MVRLLIVASAVAAAACGSRSQPNQEPASLSVVDAYAAEPLSDDVGAIYLTIRNPTDEPDTLVSVHTPIAARVMLHRMVGPRGAPQMRTVTGAEIPARGLLALRPGGLHLMLEELTAQPQVGDTISLTIELRRAGSIQVRVPVVSYLEVGERATVGSDGERR